MCRNNTRQGICCITGYITFLLLLLTAAILVAVGRKDVDGNQIENGENLMLAGGIIFLILFIVVCFYFVATCNADTNPPNRNDVLGPV
jgi:hypothetical protein